MNNRLRLTRILLLPPLVLALFSHHVYREGSLVDTLLGATGLVLLIAAMGGRIWASVHLAGRKNGVLVTEGPYAIVRNPLYLSSLVGFVGAGLAFESLTLAAVLAAIFFVSHWPEIHVEEVRLQRLFGEAYERYHRQVPRLIPRWAGVSERRPGLSERRDDMDGLVVDIRRFRAALRDCLAIPLVFVIADVLEWAKLAEVVPILIYLP